MSLAGLRAAPAAPVLVTALAPDHALGRDSARARAAWLMPALVTLVAAAVAWWASVPYIVGVFHDDGVYALLARSLATGHGFHYLQLPGTPAATHYPPLYPLALAAIWRLSPNFPENISAMLGLNAVCVGVAALGVHQLLKRWFGWRDEIAAATALCVMLGVPVLTLSGALLSEPLFLAGLGPALVATQNAIERDDRRSALTAGAAIGALMLVRTHAVALLGAALLLMVLRHDLRRAALLVGAAVAVQLPWLAWCATASPVVAPPLTGTYGAYLDFVRQGWHDGGLPLLVASVRINLHEFWLLLGDRVNGGMGAAGGSVVAVLLITLMAFGAWRAGRRAPVLPVFLALYFGIIVLWSYGPYRYAWGAWPLLLMLAAVGAEDAFSRVHRRVPRLAMALLIAMPVLAVGRTEWRGFRTRQWEQPARDASRAIVPLVEWIRRSTPAGATVLVEAPEIVMLFTGHQAAPPVPFTALEYVVPLRAEDHERGLQAMLAAVPADYLVTLSPGVRDAAHTLPALSTVGTLPGAEMFQVRR